MINRTYFNNQELVNNIFELTHNGIAIVGLDGKWLKVNNSICDILGYTKEEFYALTFQDITHPEDLNKDLSILHELLDGKKDKYQIEKRYFHKNGDIVWTILSVMIHRTDDSKPEYFISQIIDITKRKKIEVESESYLSLVIDQNDRFKDFVNIINHDLRTHVGNLSMLSDFLIEDLEILSNNTNFNTMRESIDNLNGTLNHLNETVKNNLLTNKQLVPVSLKRFVDDSFLNVTALAKVKNVSLINNVSTNTVIKTVPAYLNSLLINFLSNAIKYNSPNRESFVKISTENCDEKLTIIIADNGLGIDLKKHHRKLFSPQTMLHKREDSRGNGLFITKNHIELLGGTICVESQIDKGTSFRISFPKT